MLSITDLSLLVPVRVGAVNRARRGIRNKKVRLFNFVMNRQTDVQKWQTNDTAVQETVSRPDRFFNKGF